MNEVAQVIRAMTVIVATGVAGFCISYMKMVGDRRQKARFFGLGLLSATFVWGTIAHINDPFNPRLPIYTIAFGISLYGVTGFFKKEK